MLPPTTSRSVLRNRSAVPRPLLQESLRAMTPIARKIGLTALLTLLAVGGIGLTWSLAYGWRRPPDISQVGGTVLVYEIEDESKPPPGGSIEQLPDALRQRL